MKNHLRHLGKLIWLFAGVLLGVAATQYYHSAPPAEAGDSRHEEFIMCTGEVTVPGGRGPTEGLWILDYRSGKLLGTVVNRLTGKIGGWAEVDLVQEFKVQPRQHVHFMMTTGSLAKGQSALYLSETTTGKIGIYTLGPRPNGESGVAIRRHDLLYFRKPNPNKEG